MSKRKTLRKMHLFLGKRFMEWFKTNNYPMYLQFVREARKDSKQWQYNARQLVTRICREAILKDGERAPEAPDKPTCPKRAQPQRDPGVQ